MYKDSEMVWEGEFPYDMLEPAGVHPGSSMREVTNSMGYFARQGRIAPGLHQAWSRLGMIKERLFIDFFLYRTNMPETIKVVGNG